MNTCIATQRMRHSVARRALMGLGAAVFAALVLALPVAGWAQYPARPIRIIVPIPPGGAPDVAARVVGQALVRGAGRGHGNREQGRLQRQHRRGIRREGARRRLHAAVRPGQPDRRSIRIIYERMPVDVLRDLVPVSTVASNMFVLSVNPSLPVKTFPEFIEYARKANPPLNYASGGNGSIHHLTMELLKQRAGINLVHVPYKGGSPATTATVAGRGRGHVRGHFDRAADQGRPAARAGGHRRRRARSFSGTADHRRILSRLRDDDLARSVRAGRNAGGGPCASAAGIAKVLGRGGARRN